MLTSHSWDVEKSCKSTPEHSDYNQKHFYDKKYDKKQKINRNSFKEDKFQNKRYSESHEDKKEW